MMDPLPFACIVFSVQLLVIVCVAAVAEALGRIEDPRWRLTYWRGVALACAALPLLAMAAPAASSPGVMILLASADAGPPGPARALLPGAATAVWWVLCAGALALLLWLAAGAVRLRQLRQRSRPAVLTPDLEEIRTALAPQTELRVSSDVAQPVGFGLRRPIVLLPEGFFTMERDAQRTVACHELLHVARRDWSWILVEEVARALFWFHPAVWWLIERIQASREQLVDRLVIARIPSKRAYMAALLAFAEGDAVALATAFLRRRHLQSRLRKLAKESVMSQRRVVGTAVVLVCVMGSAIGATVVALPLDWPAGGDAASPSPQIVDGKDAGVTMPKVLSEVKPTYTPEAMQAKIEGMVLMRTVVGTDGRPTDIEVTRSLDAKYGLDEQAVAALSQWRFEPGRKQGKAVPVRVTVEMTFTLRK